MIPRKADHHVQMERACTVLSSFLLYEEEKSTFFTCSGHDNKNSKLENTERIIRFVITISMAVVMATAKPTIPYSVLPSSSISPSITDTSSPKTTDVTRNCTYVKNTGEIFSCMLEGFVSEPILIVAGIILLVVTLFVISKMVCSSTCRNWWKSDKKKKEEALVML